MVDAWETGFGKLVAGMLLGTAKALVEGGVGPSSAVRLSAAGFIMGALGRDALLELGVPLRTVQKWQREAREALEVVDTEVPPADAVNQALEAMGFPFRVVES